MYLKTHWKTYKDTPHRDTPKRDREEEREHNIQRILLSNPVWDHLVPENFPQNADNPEFFLEELCNFRMECSAGRRLAETSFQRLTDNPMCIMCMTSSTVISSKTSPQEWGHPQFRPQSFAIFAWTMPHIEVSETLNLGFTDKTLYVYIILQVFENV